MKAEFNILFAIELLHDYYGNNGKWNYVQVLPLPETESLLKSLGYLTKFIENILYILCPVRNSKPLNLPDLNSKFSFYIQPADNFFINYSNVPTISVKGESLYFSNLFENQSSGINHLSTPIKAYSNSKTYGPGDYVLGADGFTYECIRLNNGVEAPDDTVPDSKIYWVKLQKKQFVSSSDKFIIDTGIHYPVNYINSDVSFKASVKKTSHTIYIYHYNSGTGNFDKLSKKYNQLFDKPGDELKINFSGMTTGLYKVSIGTETLFFYFSSGQKIKSLPMLIDIFHLPNTHSYSFLKNDDTLENIIYTLNFGPRRTYWKYKTRTSSIVKIEDSSGDNIFKADGIQSYISERPIPFNFLPKKTLQGSSATQIIASPLPNPDFTRLVEKKDDIFITETFINY